jgi:hypothetical protein
MTFQYLKNRSWSAITREERFFCAHLYALAAPRVDDFVEFVNEKTKLDLDLGAEWELGYEVCFYRDFWRWTQQRAKEHGETAPKMPAELSQKRTFDLCLFSKKQIVIIEAKAFEGMTTKQMNEFAKDRERVGGLTGIPVDGIHLVALVSSRYKPHKDTREVFNDKLLRWKDLAEHYGNAAQPDPILKRADDVFRR